MLSFNYTDAAGNAAQTVTRTVEVVDTTAASDQFTWGCQYYSRGRESYLDANASWTDAVDGSGAVYASGEVNASDPGVYVLSYDYTDAAGNAAQTVTRTVEVVDTTVPVISLNGDANITHEGGSPYLDANASWTDAVDGSGTVVMQVDRSMPVIRELMCLVLTTPMQQAMPPRRSPEPFKWWINRAGYQFTWGCQYYARGRKCIPRCQCKLDRCGGWKRDNIGKR